MTINRKQIEIGRVQFGKDAGKPVSEATQLAAARNAIRELEQDRVEQNATIEDLSARVTELEKQVAALMNVTQDGTQALTESKRRAATAQASKRTPEEIRIARKKVGI